MVRAPTGAPARRCARLRRVRCPGCSAEVAEGTSICPSCDYIIDDSFLGASPAPSEQDPGDPSDPGRLGDRNDTDPGLRRRSSPPLRPGKQRKPARRPRPAAAANGSAANGVHLDASAEVSPAAVSGGYAEGSGGARGAASYSPVFRPEEMMDDAKLFLGRLTTADKLTLVGCGL